MPGTNIGTRFGDRRLQPTLREFGPGIAPKWLVEGIELTTRQCEAEFGISRRITDSDFGKLVELGLAEKIGSGRPTRYRIEGGSSKSLNNHKADGRNR